MRPFLLTAVSALALACPAFAQSASSVPPTSGALLATSGSGTAAAPDDQQIIVTGSRLKRTITDTVEPTFIVDAKQIETRGYTNIADALRELPEFGPGINGVGSNQSGFGPGQSFADFFNLGSQRTLVLVDGVRVVPNNSASVFGPTGTGGSQVDLNTIPVGLIERVETIAIGGAPIYGSDAIAGTVNFVLKKDYEGFEINGETGISNHSDAGNYRISALAGHNFAGGRGNITASFEYDRQEGLLFSDRASTGSGLFFTNPPTNTGFQQQLYTNQRYPSLSDQGIPYFSDDYNPNIVNSLGQPVRFGPGGSLVPVDFGTSTGDGLTSSGGNGIDLTKVENLVTPSDRYLGSIFANYQFNDHLKGFLQGWFSQSDTLNLVAQGYYNTALFNAAGAQNGNFIIPLNNPFLSTEARNVIRTNLINATNTYQGLDANGNPLPVGINPSTLKPFYTGDATSTFYLGRANEDIEPSSASGDQTTYRIVGGLSGDFGLVRHNLNWAITGTYGKNKIIDRSAQVVNQNLANALNATTDANGNIVCAPGYANASIATLSSTCSPINLFGYRSPSKAAVDYITAIARSENQNELVDVVATLSDNSFIKLPGGPAGFSVGYEHRDERARFDPGAFYLGQLQADGSYTRYGNGTPVTPVHGGFYTNEGFAEINLPFISHDTGFKYLDVLEVKAAARYVEHSIAGGDFTWTAGGRLGFLRDLVFTGNFTRAIRSPSVTELYAPISQSYFFANDPCDTQYITQGANAATRAANCAAAGIKQPFTSTIVHASQPGTQGGNPNLQNEISDSWSAGAQFRPTSLPGLALNVNWVDIDLKNAIRALTATDVLNSCYDSASYPGPFCSKFTRTAAGQVNFIQTGNLNAAEYQFAGLTANASYTFPVRYLAASGRMTFSGNYLYTDKLQYRVGAEGTVIQVNSIAPQGVGGPGSRHNATINLNYDSDFLGLELQARYNGSAVFDANDGINTRNIPGVPDVVFLNTTVSFNVTKRFALRLNVENLLDQGSPYPALAGDTAIYYAGILGRYYRVSAHVKF